MCLLYNREGRDEINSRRDSTFYEAFSRTYLQVLFR